MSVDGAVGEQRLGRYGEPGGVFGDRPAALAGDQHMHIAAERLGGGQRLVSRILERLVVLLGEKERGHQINPISFLSLSTSSPTVLTFTPAFRPVRPSGFSHPDRGETCTPPASPVSPPIPLFLPLLFVH